MTLFLQKGVLMRRKALGMISLACLLWAAVSPASTPIPLATNPPTAGDAERMTVAGLLSQDLNIAEAAREIVPEIHNPRLWLADGFLAVFRAELKALKAGPDWNALEAAKVGTIVPGGIAGLDRRTLRSLARIAAAYQFMSRLGVYLNLNSILVEKDPS